MEVRSGSNAAVFVCTRWCSAGVLLSGNNLKVLCFYSSISSSLGQSIMMMTTTTITTMKSHVDATQSTVHSMCLSLLVCVPSNARCRAKSSTRYSKGHAITIVVLCFTLCKRSNDEVTTAARVQDCQVQGCKAAPLVFVVRRRRLSSFVSTPKWPQKAPNGPDQMALGPQMNEWRAAAPSACQAIIPGLRGPRRISPTAIVLPTSPPLLLKNLSLRFSLL